MSQRALLAGVATAMAIAFALALRQGAAAPPATSPASSADAPAGSSPPNANASRAAAGDTTVMGRVATARTVTVADALTGDPIAGAKLSWSEGCTSTDADGAARLPAESVGTLVIRTDADWGSHEFRVSDATSTSIVLPVRAGLRVVCSLGTFAAATGSWILRPDRRAELQQLANPGSRPSWALEQPAVLESLLDEAGAPQPAGRSEVAWQLTERAAGEWTLHTVHHGRVCIGLRGTGTCAGDASTVELLARQHHVELVGGQVAVVHFELEASPCVGGRVSYADGTPAADVPVTVASLSDYVAGELIPHDPKSPLSPALSLYRTRGDLDFHALLQRSTRTDADGRFQVPLGATGEAAAWVHAPGFHAAFASRTTPTRCAPVDDLELVLARSTGAESVRLLTGDGRPITGVRVRLLCRDGRFQCHPTTTTTDADGNLSLEHCRPGHRYRLHFPDGEFVDEDLGTTDRVCCRRAP